MNLGNHASPVRILRKTFFENRATSNRRKRCYGIITVCAFVSITPPVHVGDHQDDILHVIPYPISSMHAYTC
ncbi:hypothetical protein ABKN59_004432 [Abortiporus biennis]